MHRRTFSLLLPVALCAVSLGCVAAEEGTGGKRVALNVKIMALSPATQEIKNAKGWSVQLTKAQVSTGGMYFYDGAPIFTASRVPFRWHNLLGIRTAHAHPGHYVPGNAMGQLIAPSSADLVAPESTLGVGDGVTGRVRSATFGYQSPAQGPLGQQLGANIVVLEGAATKDAERRVFRFEVGAADVKGTDGLAAIKGCPFSDVVVGGNGTVTVRVDLGLFMQQLDFSELAPSPNGTPVLVPATSLLHDQLVRGIKAGQAYQFSFAP